MFVLLLTSYKLHLFMRFGGGPMVCVLVYWYTAPINTILLSLRAFVYLLYVVGSYILYRVLWTATRIRQNRANGSHHRLRQNVVRTKLANLVPRLLLRCLPLKLGTRWKTGTWGDSWVFHCSSYHISASSVIWTDARQRGIYLFPIIN